MKKVFILTQFGKPHEWTQKFIDEVQFLAEYGWYWKIFTPNKFESKGNVEIIPMSVDGFNALCLENIGLDPKVELKDGLPTKPMSDFYIANGLIFKDYLKDVDYWGITNWDVVYGRLDHFIGDDSLRQCDIFSDELQTINGVFSLYRNTRKINYLFKKLPYWKKYFEAEQIIGTDEIGMTNVVQREVQKGKIRFMCPKYYPMHGHDRLEIHTPKIKLEIKVDNSLWELIADVNPPQWAHRRPFFGREIPYFHFNVTKKYPL